MTEELKDPVNIKERIKEFQSLLNAPAWVMISTMIQAQVDNLQNEILFAPVESEGDVYKLERKKGMLEGRLSLAATTMAMLEELEYDLRLAQKETE